MPRRFKPGDKVTWNTSQGRTEGVVVREQTTPIQINRHPVAASPAHPEYIVRSDKSGKEAAHRPEALRERRSSSRN